jgi:hypothetical protein
MNFFHKTGINLLLIWSSFLVTAQEKPAYTEVFNADPVLYNGRFYIFYPPSGTEGDQFISGKQFMTGSLTIKGKSYRGLSLNYDIYNQDVIYKYTIESGAVRQIIIPEALLDSFTLEHRRFQILPGIEGNKTIYQVIGEGSFRIFCFWHKRLELNRFHGASNRVFTKPLKEIYLAYNDTLKVFRNNRTFISLFPPEKREQLRKFLRENRIKISKANDESLTKVMQYCNSI